MTDKKGCTEVGQDTSEDARGVLVKSIRESERKSVRATVRGKHEIDFFWDSVRKQNIPRGRTCPCLLILVY